MASPVCTRGGKETEFFPGNFTHLKCYISALHMHFNFSFNVDGRSWKCFREITLERGTSPGCKLCLPLYKTKCFSQNSAASLCAAALIFPAL